jgi:hypothetical protein
MMNASLAESALVFTRKAFWSGDSGDSSGLQACRGRIVTDGGARVGQLNAEFKRIL